MEYINQLTVIVMNNLQYFLLGMTIFILLALIIFIQINIKLNKMSRRYHRMMLGMEGVNIEGLLMAHIDELHQGMNKVDKIAGDYARLDQITRRSIQKVGVVRFNAFEDTGSDLSYAVALLDAENNGVIFSSIFGRNESRVYAKPILASQSSYFLTTEEKQAIEQAQKRQ